MLGNPESEFYFPSLIFALLLKLPPSLLPPLQSELVRWLTEPYPAGRPSAEDITGSQLYSDLHRAAEHSPDNHLIPRL